MYCTWKKQLRAAKKVVFVTGVTSYSLIVTYVRWVVCIYFILLFGGDGPLPTQPASLYRVIMQRSLASMHCGEKTDGLFLLRQTCRNKPSIVDLYGVSIRLTIDIAEIFRIGRVELRTGSTSCGYPFYQRSRLSVMGLWGRYLVATAWLKCWPKIRYKGR